jgi:hypothetical protein
VALAERLSASDQDTLVVSHAGMMAYLSAELRRRGFAGPKLRIAKYATAYIYEKCDRNCATATDEAKITVESVKRFESMTEFLRPHIHHRLRRANYRGQGCGVGWRRY